MRIFVIEAYGGGAATNGAIRHFAVQAGSLEQALDILRQSGEAERFDRFEAVEESDEVDSDEAGIIGEGEGLYTPHL